MHGKLFSAPLTSSIATEAMESIQFQRDTVFIEKVSGALDKIRTTINLNINKIENIPDSIKKVKRINNMLKDDLEYLNKLFYDRIGIPFKIKYGYILGAIGVIFPPLNNQDINITRDEILEIADKIEKYKKSKDADPEVLESIEDFIVSFEKNNELYESFCKNNIVIDYKNARIKNWPRSFRPTIEINFVDLFRTIKLSNREIISVILHEVGHQFRSIEALGTSIRVSSLTMKAALAHIRGDKEKVQSLKVKIVETIDDKKVKKTIENEDELLVWGIKTYTYHVGYLMDVTKNPETITRSFEREADSFATRFGLGYEIGAALVKIETYFGKTNSVLINTLSAIWDSIRSSIFLCIVVYFFVTLKMLFYIFLFAVIYFILSRLFMESFLLDPEFIPHPEIKRRLFSIKKETIGILKETTLSEKDKKYMLDQFDNLSELIDSVENYNVDLFRIVGNMINPYSRSALKSVRLNDLLDELSNPDFYVYAQQLGE